MLHFKEHDWMLIHGASRISAWIDPTTKSRKDVSWDLTMNYIATGAQWRRVQSWHRPTMYLWLNSIQIDVKNWRDLELVNFWNPDPEEKDADGFPLQWAGGSLEMNYTPKDGGEKSNLTWSEEHIWRIVSREGGRFIVELAACADGTNRFGDWLKELLAVTTEGDVEMVSEPDPEFWKGKAEVYLVEELPFGLVTVQVPRNCNDPSAYAVARARALLGVGEPEHIEVVDHLKSPHASELTQNNIYVHLHYHGYYED